MHKFQVFFRDVQGNYSFAYFVHLKDAVTFFRFSISKTECLICDLRNCGSLDCVASFRNYKYLKIKGL